MNNQNIKPKFSQKIKKSLIKPPVSILIAVFLIVAAAYAGFGYFKENPNQEEAASEQKTTPIKTITLKKGQEKTTTINTSGNVKSSWQTEIVAAARGSLRELYFKIGDEVKAGQVLAVLYEDSASAALNNAQTNYLNMQANLMAVERNAEESLRQSELAAAQTEIGLANAQSLIDSANIGIKTAEDNLNRAKITGNKNMLDAERSAVIGFKNNLNTVYNTLEQVNYIIKAEGNYQLPGLDNLLGVINLTSLAQAKASYLKLKNTHHNLSKKEVTEKNIRENQKEIIEALNLSKILVDDTIFVLENTITSVDFNQSSLNAQKNFFINLRANVLSAQTVAENTLQNMENLGLALKQETEALKNNLKSANNALNQALIGYDNALAGLNNAKQAINQVKKNNQQQILISRNSIDNALGQVNLLMAQMNDLAIKAPLSGIITQKYVDLGLEINPGQKIAQISRLDDLIVETGLSSEEIYKIKLGQKVLINNDFEGFISFISPVADPASGKVKIEISFDNKKNQLIQDTFVDLSIDIIIPEQAGDDVFFVPLGAVIIAQNENYVFVASEGRAKKIQVEIGRLEGSLIEILSGLKKQDELIIDGHKTLTEGDLITL